MRYWVVVDNGDKTKIEGILSYNPGEKQGKTVFSTLFFEQPGNKVSIHYYTVSWTGNSPTIVKRDEETVESEIAEKKLNGWRAKTQCGPLQFRRALRAAGLMDTIKAYIETADEEVVEAWEYASVFKRNDPFIIAVQEQLGKTDEELDDIFKLALTFP